MSMACTRRYVADPAANTDFVPGLTQLTKYNARKGVLTEAERTGKDAPPRLARANEEVAPSPPLDDLGYLD